MDDLFLKRVITPKADKPARGGQASWQRLVQKEQKSIFEKSIGSPCNLQFLLKI
jgi:hypothetical protein